jgi:RimJ/RimL family protein N-acetyltransferase
MGVDAVTLVAVDERLLVSLLAVAVGDANPLEVMAPVAGPPGWTADRRAAFVEYHRSRRAADPRAGEATFAVTVAGEVVGAARLAAVEDDPAALEVGLWLGRRSRGKGIARAVLPTAADIARGLGAHRLVARTTATNDVAVAALRGAGFVLTTTACGRVEAALHLG